MTTSTTLMQEVLAARDDGYRTPGQTLEEGTDAGFQGLAMQRNQHRAGALTSWYTGVPEDGIM